MSRILDFSDSFTSNAPSTSVGTPASSVTNVAAGNISSTNQQAVNNELQTHIDTLSAAVTSGSVTLSGVQTLTNKTLTSPVINTPTGIVKADVGLSAVDNTSDSTKNSATATLTNKTLTSPAINGATFDLGLYSEQGSTPATPSSGIHKFYYKTDGKLYTLDSTGTEVQVGAGSSSSSGVNYITNSDAETNTTGWAVYSNGASNVPTTGTGGSPSSTFTRSTSSPLRGTGSFLWTKPASIVQGEGFSYAFTIADADKGKVLQGSCNYAIASGTYSDDDFRVWIYDVTNATLIACAPYLVKNHTLPADKMFFEFQTASNSNSYRLIFHCASVSSAAATVKFDDWTVGPQAKLYGTPVTDKGQTYTPTLTGFGTATNIKFQYWVVGDTCYINGTFGTGTVGATTGTITLPNSWTIDSTKIMIANNSSNAGQSVGMFATSSTNNGANIVTAVGTSTSLVYLGGKIGGGGDLSPALVNAVAPSTTVCSVNFAFPVLGKASTVQLSSDANTRIVVARATGTPATVSAGNPVIFPTTSYDTHNAYSSSTGRYTVSVGGYCRVTCAVNSSTASESYKIYKNAAVDVEIFNTNTAQHGSGSGIIKVIAGDILDVRPISAGSGTMGGGGFISFEMLSGPAQIAASDAVNCRYFASATTISSSLATVVWTTMDYDATGAMVLGLFTCPSPGKYLVNSSLSVSGTFALNGTADMQIQKNSVVVSEDNAIAGGAQSSMTVNCSDIIRCLTGDIIRIQVSTTATSPTITSGNSKNFISIARVGNY